MDDPFRRPSLGSALHDKDPRAALDWLEKAFGFERKMVITDDTRNQGLIVLEQEDGTACERMQQAMHSPRFEVGPLAVEHEKPIEDFHRNLLSFLS